MPWVASCFPVILVWSCIRTSKLMLRRESPFRGVTDWILNGLPRHFQWLRSEPPHFKIFNSNQIVLLSWPGANEELYQWIWSAQWCGEIVLFSFVDTDSDNVQFDSVYLDKVWYDEEGEQHIVWYPCLFFSKTSDFPIENFKISVFICLRIRTIFVKVTQFSRISVDRYVWYSWSKRRIFLSLCGLFCNIFVCLFVWNAWYFPLFESNSNNGAWRTPAARAVW